MNAEMARLAAAYNDGLLSTKEFRDGIILALVGMESEDEFLALANAIDAYIVQTGGAK